MGNNIVSVLMHTMMTDKMKHVKHVLINVPIVQLMDVLLVLKTELNQKMDVHVILKPDNTKMEMQFAQIVIIDVQPVLNGLIVKPALMLTDLMMKTVLVKVDIMMMELHNVNHVTTDVLHV